ncbi:PLP-dependent transferase [Clostridium gasigenes]|uniref:trans-sulfuration enzyme family protein n=1 Tax=Clostridium gasigenes TaxID=94869 RepID=UPI0014386666|nr:PLP-dependent aspartate aminotransferase family protein [Clostridium gasigenes]NKF07804.1 PLP-dependent transferase [Clostridium gasigenes]QSW20428.1 PLP-dependent transferase [Clostridium gasigenes]
MSNFNTCHFETSAVRGASGGDEKTGAISFPIYQAATFKHNGLHESTGYDYSRLQNPTREELEKTIALLECGKESLGFSTGVAAITACINLLESGDHVILSEDLYGGTFRLFNDIYRIYHIEATFVDTSKEDEIIKAIKNNTKVIFVETPSNPLMRITDINMIVDICKKYNFISIVDNTFLTPYYQKPLNLGIDLVVHSGTKYLGGHNDVLAGFIVANNEELISKLRIIQKSTGATLSPFDSWLVLRGLKTLHIRMDRCQENAIKIANWLKENKNIDKVFYVGLKEHKGYDVNQLQSRGFGAMISFRVKDKNIIPKILSGVRVISFAESLGGVETLVTYPYTQTHAEIPLEIKEKLGVDEYLLRLSIGIEKIDDLIKDLEIVLEE